MWRHEAWKRSWKHKSSRVPKAFGRLLHRWPQASRECGGEGEMLRTLLNGLKSALYKFFDWIEWKAEKKRV